MASLHPAFPFHQRETLLVHLDKIKFATEDRQQNRYRINAQAQEAEYLGPAAVTTEASLDERTQGQGQRQCASQTPPSCRTQREAVHIEKIVLKGMSQSRTDREYNFEVKWSDFSYSNVRKTQLELESFLLKLPKEQSTESFEKGILRLLNQGDMYESRGVERNLKEKFLSAPQAFRRTRKVCGFFLCESSSSSSCSCSRCNPAALSFKEDGSEASSQEEIVYLDPYVLGHRKKHVSNRPCISVPDAKRSQEESVPKGSRSLPNWRRKSCTHQPDQEASGGPEQHQGSEKRGNHPASMRQPLGPDREKGKKAYLAANGSMVPPASQRARQSTGKDGDSGQEVYGETSSESYSSASSPQHHEPESLDSEDEEDKDTDSTQGPADSFFPWQEVAGGAMPTIHHLVSAKPVGEPPSLDYPPNTFMHPLPCILPNGALPADAPLPGDPEQMPMVLPGFGSLALGLHSPGSPALQPPVQHFKTAPPQTTASSEGVTTLPAHQPLVESISVITPGPPYASPLQPAYSNPDPAAPLTPSVPLGDLSIPHIKHPDVSLFSDLPSLYPMAPIPTSVMATLGVAPSPGQVQAVVPQSVPTRTPGPAPGSTQTDSASYVNSTSNSVTQQQAQPQQQQQQQTTHQEQAMCCGACGCRGGCGNSRTAPSFFFPHQMAPRQVFGAPPIFQLTSMCASNYLSQPPPQSNGQAQLTFFPHAPYAGQTLLHTHSDHVLGTQLGYSLQQMVSPFNRFYPHMYPSSVGMVTGSGGGGGALGGAVGINKNNGNVSCYNCGVSGHYAQDCKQPSVDSSQQGSFRLKYAASHSPQGLDNAS
uniref:zinc finger CCHC domain-containing protein 2-like n=1 Tax=Oncorhynchus gorbuscha TaxID=8017 RepID=UPI001EAE99A3|nr:zinc finger CCHC domain-containing protein 2-like [Oncorhynchus gorbuscha]